MPKKAQDEGVSPETLKKFEEDRLFLVSIGLDIGDVDRVRNVFQNLKKIEFDTKLAVSILRSFQDLQSKIALLEVEESEESTKLEALHKGVKAVDEELHEKEALVKQVRALQASGLSLDMVEEVRKAAVDVAAKHQIRADDAIERFRKEVLKDYDSMLGLQPKAAEAKRELEKAKEGLIEEQAKLDEAHKALGSLGAVVKSYTALQDAGVKDEMILALDEMMDKTGLSTEAIKGEFLKHRSLSQTLAGLEKDGLEARRKLVALKEENEAQLKEFEDKISAKKAEVKKAEADAREAVARVADAQGLTADFDSVKQGVDKMKGDSTSLELLIGQQKMELESIVDRVADANKVEADLEVVRREKERQKAELEFFARDDERFDAEWQEKLRKYQEKLTAAQVERAKLVGTMEALKEVVQKEMKATKYLLTFDRLTDDKTIGQLAPEAAVLSMQAATEGFVKYLGQHKDEVWPSPELADTGAKFAAELANTYPKVAPK